MQYQFDAYAIRTEQKHSHTEVIFSVPKNQPVPPTGKVDMKINAQISRRECKECGGNVFIPAKYDPAVAICKTCNEL